MSSIFLCRNITRLHITLHHDTNSSVATKVSLHIEVSFEGNVSDCAISPGSVNPDQILQNEIKASRNVVIISPKRHRRDCHHHHYLLLLRHHHHHRRRRFPLFSFSSLSSLVHAIMNRSRRVVPEFNWTLSVFPFLMHEINTIVNNNNNNFITMVSGSSQLFINIIKIFLKIWIKFSVGVNQLCGLRRSRSHAEVDENLTSKDIYHLSVVLN